MSILTSRTELLTVSDLDWIHIVDVSDTTDSPQGTSKKIRKSNLFAAIGGGAWGEITGTLSDQTDLQSALDGKSNVGHTHTFASLTSKPTTIAGYGITDFNSLGDARWLGVAGTAADSNLLDGIDSTGFVKTDSTNQSIGGIKTFTGSKVQIEGGAPVLEIRRPSSALDEKNVYLINNGTTFQYRFYNDAYSSYSTPFQITRNGTSISEIELNATLVDVTGNLTATGEGSFGNIVRAEGLNPTIQLKSNGTGNIHTGWISYRDSANLERGFVGFGSTSNSHLTIANYYSGKSLVLESGGGLTYDGNFTATGTISGNRLQTTVQGADEDLLTFNTERPWRFRQGLSGANTSLDLVELTGSKSFKIGDGTTTFFSVHAGTGNLTAGIGVFDGTVTGRGFNCTGTGTGTPNTAIIGFYEINGSTRQGYVGYPSSSNSHLYVRNDVSNKQIILESGGEMTYNGTARVDGNIVATHHITSGDGFFYSYNGSTYGNVRAGMLMKGSTREVHFYTDGASRGHINNSGNMTISGTMTASAFYESSDRTLKHKIKSISPTFKSFEFKNIEGLRYGVIAQEIEQTNPELVQTNADGIKSVNYTDLLVMKVAEQENRLQEQGEEIERLKILVEQLLKG